MLTLVLFILLAGFALDTFVDALTLASVRRDPALPAEFENIFPPEKYRSSLEYQSAKLRLALIRRTVDLVVFLGFWFAGGFGWLDQLARALERGPVVSGVLYIGALMGLRALLALPFSVYETFVLEERFGFNRTTPSTFGSDILKGIVLATILGAPILGLVLLFFERFGQNAWIYAWIAFTSLQLLLLFLAPAVILPLFNRFDPLPEGELRDAIQAYAKSQDFLLQGIYRMDSSKRSSKSNAFFTGFGRFRKLVLFDTLIEKHSVPELVSVLAHEIGHFKLKHIPKTIVLSIASSGLLFFFLSLLLNNEALFSAFKVTHVSVYASLVFAGFLYAPISRLISIAGHALSRKHEFEADRFARETGGKDLASALKKLSVDNLSHLRPPRLRVILDYTHPPVLERLRALLPKGAS